MDIVHMKEDQLSELLDLFKKKKIAINEFFLFFFLKKMIEKMIEKMIKK
jgi:hypothetical protein